MNRDPAVTKNQNYGMSNPKLLTFFKATEDLSSEIIRKKRHASSPNLLREKVFNFLEIAKDFMRFPQDGHRAFRGHERVIETFVENLWSLVLEPYKEVGTGSKFEVWVQAV